MLTREECLLLCIPAAAAPSDTTNSNDEGEKGDDTWCWHCCHEIQDMVIPLPIAYDDRRDSWTHTGQFCSWGCAKGYAIDKQKLEWSHLLAMLKRHVTGKRTRTVPAPPRRCLRVFGGSMTLNEFRAKSNEGVIIGHLPTRMIPIQQITVQRHISAQTNGTGGKQRDVSMVNRMATTTEPKNETLRLKRPHAQVKKNTGLEMFLA
jgi:hypothetical protein